MAVTVQGEGHDYHTEWSFSPAIELPALHESIIVNAVLIKDLYFTLTYYFTLTVTLRVHGNSSIVISNETFVNNCSSSLKIQNQFSILGGNPYITCNRNATSEPLNVIR